MKEKWGALLGVLRNTECWGKKMDKKNAKKISLRVFVMALVLTIVFVSAGNFIDNSQGDFSNGTYYNTKFNSTAVMLKYWNDTEQELPNNQATDEWGVNMTGNILLMHMNEASSTIVDSSGQENNGTAPPIIGSISIRVGASSDDAEECLSTNSMDLSSSDLELIYDAGTCGGNQEVGIRFNALTIPRGAVVTNAYLEFEIDTQRTANTNLSIYGQAADNPGTFTIATSDITGRTKTNNFVQWDNVPNAAVDAKIISPNISSVVQEIIDRSGWASGNSMVFIINGTGVKETESYNGESAAAPLLVVNYSIENIPANSSGKLNTALSFDGVDDSINLGLDHFSNSDLADGTISLWFNPRNYTSGHDYIVNLEGRIYIALDNGDIKALIYDGGNKIVQGINTVNAGNWYHITLTWDGSNMHLYVNEESDSIAAGEITIDAVSRNQAIGASYTLTDNEFNGTIDEVAIWNRSLSATEISAIYQRQKAKYGGGNSGNFTSQVFNARGNAVWENVSWLSNAIGELPANQVVETSFENGNVNMTGNVLLMHMNDDVSGTSQTIEDTSGNGNDGTTYDNTDCTVNGKLNKGCSFDGTGDYIDLGNSLFIDGLTAMTIEAWVYGGDNNVNPIMTRWHPSDVQNQFMFKIDATSNKLRSYIASSITDGGANNGVTTTATIPLGTWTQVVMVYDGSGATNSDRLKFYIDGSNQAITFSGTIPASLTSPSQNLYIGNQQNTQYLSGTLDEVAIWNRSLSVQEVQDIYKRGITRLNLSVRGCDDSVCLGESFEGPYGNGSIEMPANQVTTIVGQNHVVNMTGNVLLMHMNEASGAIEDSSGGGNDGSYNGVLYSQDGKLNTAIGFDGSNDYVGISDDASLDFGTGSFTFSTWVKSTNSATGYVLNKQDQSQGDNHQGYFIRASSTIVCRVSDGDEFISETISTDIRNDGLWHYLTCRLDTSSNTLDVFLDGSKGTGISTATLGSTSNSDPIRIGHRQKGAGSDNYFNGPIDEVAIWNRSLSATEIQTLYKMGVTNHFESSPQNLSFISNNQYFQYKFDLSTDDSSYTPELYNISINYNSAPDVPILNSPANGSSTNVNSILLNATVTDSEGENMTVWFYGDGNVINTTTANNGSIVFYNWTALSDNSHNWSVIVSDGSLNTSSDVYFFNVDASAPSVELIHPADNQTLIVNDSIAIVLNITDVSSIDSIIANVTLENGSVVQLSNFSYGLQSDNFESDSLGINWTKTNITSGSQICIVDVNETVSGKMFISVNGAGGTTSAQCGVNSAKKLDGNFDINISFNLTSFEDDTLFSFRSNSLNSFLPAGSRVFTDIERRSGVSKYTLGYNDGSSTTQQSVSTTDTYGKFRIRRFNTTGTPAFNLYYFNNSNSSWVNLLGNISMPHSHRTQYIQLKPSSTASNYGELNITLDDFQVSGDNFRFAFFNENSYVGRYNLSIFVNDSFGFVNDSGRGYFLVDVSNHAPSRPFLTNPDPDDVIRDVINISWSTVLDQEGDAFKFNISLLNSDGSFNSSIVSDYGDASSTFYSWNTTIYPDGIYGLEIKVFENETDEGLSNTETLAGNITIDNSVPDEPILNSPMNYSNLSVNSVLLNTTLSNPDEDSMTVWFYGDGILLDTLSGIVSGSSITYYWTGLNDGLHNWSVITYDGTYNSSLVSSFFTVDTVNPVVYLESPANNSEESASNTVLFSYNVSDVTTNISNCSLYIDGVFKEVNTSIVESASNLFSVYLYQAYYNWSVSCYDSAGNLGESDLHYLNVTLQAPAVTLSNPVDNYNSLTSEVIFNCSATDNSGLVNMTLYGNWSGGWHANETKSLTGTGDSVTFNKTILDGNYVWNCLAYDDEGLSDYYFEGVNKTLTIDSVIPSATINSPSLVEKIPKLTKILNVTISENGNIWYNLNSLGNLSLCFDCMNGAVTLNFTDYGSQNIVVYANDTLGNVNRTTLSFILNLDTDGDGVIDSLDSDDDNDGIADMSDSLNGNLSNVNSNIVGLNLSVDGSGDLTQQFAGLLHVNFTNGAMSLIEFNYNFSAGQILNLGEVIVKRQEGNSTGSMLVKGVNLTSGQTKTVYVDDLNSGLGNVCIKDSEISLISDISSDCSGSGEVRVNCNGTSQSGFNCTDLGSRYRIEGLSNSGVIETGNVSVSPDDGGDTGNGGSSGGGGSSGSGTGIIPANETKEESEFSLEEEISEQLFDIKLELEDAVIKNINELTVLVSFKSFGSIPTLVNLTFIFLNQAGEEVYFEEDSIIVETEKILRKKFKRFELEKGNYIVILRTLYNRDVADEFRKEFEIEKREIGITGNVIGWIKMEGGGYSLAGVLVLIFLGVLTGIFKGWEKKKNKKKLTFETFHRGVRFDFLNQQKKLKAMRLREERKRKKIVLMKRKLTKLKQLKEGREKLKSMRIKLREKFLRIKHSNIEKRVKVYEKSMKERIAEKKNKIQEKHQRKKKKSSYFGKIYGRKSLSSGRYDKFIERLGKIKNE